MRIKLKMTIESEEQIARRFMDTSEANALLEIRRITSAAIRRSVYSAAFLVPVGLTGGTLKGGLISDFAALVGFGFVASAVERFSTGARTREAFKKVFGPIRRQDGTEETGTDA